MTTMVKPAIQWTREEITAAQDASLPAVLEHAYEHSTFMRRVWDDAGVRPSDIADRDQFFERAPFVTADDVRGTPGRGRDPFNGMLCLPIHELTVIGSTSGTTGMPQPLPQHTDDVRDQSTVRDLEINGVGPGSIVLLSNNGSRSGHSAKRFNKLGAYPIFFDWDPGVAGRLVAAARRFRPTHWWIVNGPLVMALQKYARETGDDLAEAFSSIGPTVWGGEPLGAAMRQTLSEWGLSVRQMTSLGNVGPAVECGMQDGSHTWEDLVLVECLDPGTQQPVADGARGELVVTALADRAAPLIRYRSGDLVEYTAQPCGCGCAHGRIKTVGRFADIVPVDGREVLPSDVWALVERIPETADGQFQLIRPSAPSDTLRLRVGYTPGGPRPVDDLREELEAAVGQELGLRCSVQLLTVDELLSSRAGTKLRRVVDA